MDKGKTTDLDIDDVCKSVFSHAFKTCEIVTDYLLEDTNLRVFDNVFP